MNLLDLGVQQPPIFAFYRASEYLVERNPRENVQPGQWSVLYTTKPSVSRSLIASFSIYHFLCRFFFLSFIHTHKGISWSRSYCQSCLVVDCESDSSAGLLSLCIVIPRYRSLRRVMSTSLAVFRWSSPFSILLLFLQIFSLLHSTVHRPFFAFSC